ncbi:MAG: glycosyltransferase family 25 protein [Methylobacterium mesophilicum]|nr:glycosyltransferase family 25 protein [Methylobacterium mesophilicum]
MNGRAYVIHLARATGRRANAERLLASLPMPGEILDAVDAKEMSAAEFAEAYRPGLFKPRYPFPLRQTEIACFLSHRKAWAAIAASGLDGGLILEDDVTVDVTVLEAILSAARAVLKPGDYLRFPQYPRDESGPELVHSGEVSIIEPRVPGRRMFMQWVGRDAAAGLVDATRIFDRPVDALLQLPWLLPARILAARPICVREISGELGGTTVQGKGRTLAETLAREIKRPLYRAAVHWHGLRKT